MTAKQLGTSFPPIVLRKFEDFTEAYRAVAAISRILIQLRRQMTSAVNDHGSRLTPTEGAGAPSSTPTDVGLHYLDTSAKDMYISVGTASSADWKKITP